MGILKHLLGRKRGSDSDDESKEAPIPTSSTEIVKLSQAWPGNLPCVHGSSDGCNNHNPGKSTLHYDSSLLQLTPNSTPILPSGNQTIKDKDIPPNHIIPEIQSHLPRTDAYLETIPRVHKSVPWSLSFYHIHEATQNSSTLTTLLSCSATTGSNPPLSWTVTPLLDEKSLLLEYAMAFTVQADLGAWTEDTQHGRAVSKHALIGSGFREFTPCAHTHLSFTSHRGEGKNHTRYGGVNFTRKVMKEGSSKFREEKGEWRSEKADEVEPMYCDRCYTDTHLSFNMIGKVVIVSVKVYKNVGEGMYPGDLKWLSLTRGVDVRRGEAEVGRMRKAFADVEEGFF